MMTLSPQQTNPSFCQLHDCLAKGTRVTMADFSEKRIENIRIGDQVLDGLTRQAVIVTDCWSGRELHPLVQINTSETMIICSKEHPIFTNIGFMPAHELLPEHYLISENGHRIPIFSIQGAIPSQVYNLSLGQEEHALGASFYANGILVGDMCLELELKRQSISSNYLHHLKMLYL